MSTLGTIYLTLLLLSPIISLSLAWVTWRQRRQAGAVPLLLLCLSSMILSVSSAMEAFTPSLAGKEIWVNCQYLGYAYSPVLYFLLVIQYLGNAYWSTVRRVAWLLIIPTLTVLFACTNGAHHLMRGHLHLEWAESLSFLGKTVGPWWWVHIVYSLCLMLASIFALLHPRLTNHSTYRSHTLTLLLGLLIPLVSSVLYVCGVSLSPDMDLTPALAAVGGVFIGISVLRFRLFEITPIARDHVIESMNDGVLVIDRHLRVADLNAACARMLAVQPAAALGRSIGDVLADLPALEQLLLSDVPDGYLEFAQPDGDRHRYWEVHLSSLYQHKHLVGRIARFHDITKRKQTEEVLRCYELLASHSRDIVLFMRSDDGRLLEANAAASAAYGYDREDLLKMTVHQLHADDTGVSVAELLAEADANGILFETLHRRRDGSTFPVEVSSRGATINNVHTRISIVRDITERKLAEEKLLYLSYHDTLTGLHNRRYFQEELHRLQPGRRSPISLLAIDVDGLKVINDEHGHAAGDRMLKTIAEVLLQSFRAEDVVARIGGDEFAVVLPDTSAETAAIILKRVEENRIALQESIPEIPLHFSIGMATATAGDSLEAVLKRADRDMYAVKTRRKRHTFSRR